MVIMAIEAKSIGELLPSSSMYAGRQTAIIAKFYVSQHNNIIVLCKCQRNARETRRLPNIGKEVKMTARRQQGVIHPYKAAVISRAG